MDLQWDPVSSLGPSGTKAQPSRLATTAYEKAGLQCQLCRCNYATKEPPAAPEQQFADPCSIQFQSNARQRKSLNNDVNL
ncbi:hypothetical protein AVEN_29410-1 [Araneus ventricosus]|uniref:Uncharacterized protein n=1 Tax=Araneus ventricosus TaxID=182803 RepID=A0A4Y2CYT6_ARAVE|nr:hypothetical protein AVEN_29410-1 [Araneus ventricosus]